MRGISVVITTYGDDHWRDLAWSHAYPSAVEQADEVIVHHAPELEIGPARNVAASRATGDWLIFLDADDQLDPGYVAAMWAAAENQHYQRLFRPAVQWVKNGRPQPPTMLPAGDLRVDNYMVVGTMISKATFEEVGGFEDYPHGFEDWSLWAKAWKYGGCSIIAVPEAIYIAHVNPKSKHKQMWRNRRQQVETHQMVQRALFPEELIPPRRYSQRRR